MYFTINYRHNRESKSNLQFIFAGQMYILLKTGIHPMNYKQANIIEERLIQGEIGFRAKINPCVKLTAPATDLKVCEPSHSIQMKISDKELDGQFTGPGLHASNICLKRRTENELFACIRIGNTRTPGGPPKKYPAEGKALVNESVMRKSDAYTKCSPSSGRHCPVSLSQKKPRCLNKDKKE
jgi:hypothetical protein